MRGKQRTNDMKIFLAIAAIVMLSSCTSVGAGLAVGADRVAKANDIAAEATTRANCQMAYGAYLRRPANERLGVKLICDPAALENFIRTQ